jgi:hypothetical protein
VEGGKEDDPLAGKEGRQVKNDAKKWEKAMAGGNEGVEKALKKKEVKEDYGEKMLKREEKEEREKGGDAEQAGGSRRSGSSPGHHSHGVRDAFQRVKGN